MYVVVFKIGANVIAYGKCDFVSEDFPKENQKQAKKQRPFD